MDNKNISPTNTSRFTNSPYEDDKYGLLLNQDIKINRAWFIQMTKLIGINVIYRAPRDVSKHYNEYGEVVSNYEPPRLIGCIFEEHPDQKTTKKLGWVSELQDNASVIHVPYDLPGLQIGALFIVPSGIDKAKGRLFRVTKMSNIMIYPSSIACEIVPEYENSFERSQLDHSQNNFNLLREEEEGC